MYFLNFINKTIGRFSYHSANATQGAWKDVLMLPKMFNPKQIFFN
jgi:hypothetical protein